MENSVWFHESSNTHFSVLQLAIIDNSLLTRIKVLSSMGKHGVWVHTMRSKVF